MAPGVPQLLEFQQSFLLRSSSSTDSVNSPVVWVLFEVFLRGFFWEMANGLFLYSASLGSTVEKFMALLGVFLRPLVPGSYLFVSGSA